MILAISTALFAGCTKKGADDKKNKDGYTHISGKEAAEFVENADNLSTANKKRLKDTTESGKPCARCGFADFTCTEGCKWGKNGALTRTI